MSPSTCVTCGYYLYSILFCTFLSPEFLTDDNVYNYKSKQGKLYQHIKRDCDNDWKSPRLPEYIIPIGYDLLILLNLSNDSFIGLVHIEASVLNDTSYVILNSKHLSWYDVEVVTVRGDVKSPEIVENISKCPKFGLFYIRLERVIPKGSTMYLHVLYGGKISNSMYGIYQSSYTDPGSGDSNKGTIHRLISTQFEPDHARQGFPSFDEPKFKATFRLRLGRPSALISVSNTAQRESIPFKRVNVFVEPLGRALLVLVLNDYFSLPLGELIIDHYEPTPPMSSYLLAFVVCDYASITGWARGIGSTPELPIRIKVSLYAPTHMIRQVGLALDVAIKLLEFYESYLTIPYPLSKIDLIGVPNFAAGAMENWGLLIFRMTDLFYDPKQTPSNIKQRVVIVIAHEIAHQWFGNLVTMRWWNDLWLNEGFASYMQYFATGHLFPSWRMMDQLAFDQMVGPFSIDSLLYSHPIVSHQLRDDVKGSRSQLFLEAAFDSITYDKSSILIRMLKDLVLTPENFRRGIIYYLKKYRFASSSYVDLLKCLDTFVENRSMTTRDFMDPWLRQSGYPLLTVSDPLALGGKFYVNISQTIFRSVFELPFDFVDTIGKNNNSTATTSYKDYCESKTTTWPLPLLYVTSNEPTEYKDSWLGRCQDNTMIKLENFQYSSASTSWIKFNHDYMGFYRTNYGTTYWNNLKNQLYSNHIIFDSMDRIEMIDNIIALSKNGFLPADTALDFISYVTYGVERETDPLVLMMTIEILLSHRHRIRDAIIFNQWSVVIGRVLNPILAHIPATAWNYVEDEDHLESILQAKVILTAVMLGHNETVARAKVYFERILYPSNLTVNPNFINGILLAVVKYGSITDWENVWNLYLTSTVYSLKSQYLNALPSTKQTTLLLRLLEYSLDRDKIKPQDVISLIGKIASNHHTGVPLVWSFIKSHWQYFTTYVASSVSSKEGILRAVVKHITTLDQLTDFHSFYWDNVDSYLSANMNQTLEALYLNLAWLQNNRENVVKWVRKQIFKRKDLHDTYYNLY